MKEVLVVLFCWMGTLFAGESPEILFVGFDAGETNIFIQVLDGWDCAEKAQLLTLSTATKVAKDAHVLQQKELIFPCSDRLSEIPVDQLVPLEAISSVVVGMYSAPARQIAELSAEKGIKVVAVWDNFSTYDKLPADLVRNVEQIIIASTVVLTPSLEIAKDLNTRFNTDKALPLGQPTLEVWEKAIKGVNVQQALEKTPFHSELPIVTYIGGYEEKNNDYNAAFALFAQSLVLLKRPVQLIVQLHPRSDGAYERQVLSALAKEHLHYPRFVVGGETTTFESVALSSIGVCHRSTVAIQALFAGKLFLHVDVAHTPFSHFAMERGLIAQLHSPEEIASHLETHLESVLDVATLYEKGGIVPNATRKFRELLAHPCAEEKAAAPSK